MPISRRAFLALSGASVMLSTANPEEAAAQIFSELSAPQNDTALKSLLATSGESAVIRGDWVLNSTVTLPDGLRSLEIAEGARIAVQGDRPAMTRRGRIDVLGTIPALQAGSSGFTAPFAGIREGDILFVAGHDTIPNSPDKHGYLRRVVAVSGSTVTFDRPVPRQISINPRCGRVTLAPAISIFGKGKVFNSVPSDSTGPLLDFFAVDSIDLRGVEVLNNGGPGVTVSHCWGGVVAPWVHDLLDDGKTHFGYGVNVAGATRDLRVTGSASRVRHGVTTNPGPATDGFGYAGEPENCTFEQTVWDCTDKAVDTHRAGWGNTIIPRVTGGKGGVQVRADNTRVFGGSIVGTVGPGIAIHESVSVAPTVDGVSISDLWPSGNAILALSPVEILNIRIRDCAWTNIILSSDSTVVGGSISAGHPVGVEFRGNGNRVSGISLGESVTTPYVEAAGASGNSFSASGVSPDLLPAPKCTAAPTISGNFTVKSEVSSSPGSWSRSGLKYSWSWYRDGVPISSAVGRTYPRYVLTSADVGHRISVEVTASRTGYEAGRASSERSSLIANSGAIANLASPRITGTAQPGKFCYATRGEWDPYPTSYTYQWLRDDSAIAGATSASYQVRTEDAGRSISVRVSAAKAGFTSGVAPSSSIDVPMTALTPTQVPAMTGSAKVGKFLYISRGQWTPYPSSVTFQWTVDGSPVTGSTGGSFQIRSGDVGRAVTVTVTAKRPGFADGRYVPSAVRA